MMVMPNGIERIAVLFRRARRTVTWPERSTLHVIEHGYGGH
jgi:hypothetical protein